MGANFSPITDNHFTVMSKDHIPQKYHDSVIPSMLDLINKTDGGFRAIFNAQAGASIISHLHLQATTSRLPVEDIHISTQDVIYSESNTTVYKPDYYLPLFISEGVSAKSLSKISDHIINQWIVLNPKFHTVNILALKQTEKYRVYIFLRDSRKLIGAGKVGAMGTFECSGLIVLSAGSIGTTKPSTQERLVFENSSLGTIQNLLNQITPDENIEVSELKL